MKMRSSLFKTLGIIAIVGILVVVILATCSSGNDGAPAPANTANPASTAALTNPPKPTPTTPPANTPNPILNILWQWVSVTDQPTGLTTLVPSPTDYTISFYPDGTLGGKADCNTFEGTFSQKNGLTIKLGATTRMECGEASLSQEYLNLLSDVVAGGPDGAGGLALENAGGETRILFRNGGATVQP